MHYCEMAKMWWVTPGCEYRLICASLSFEVVPFDVSFQPVAPSPDVVQFQVAAG